MFVKRVIETVKICQCSKHHKAEGNCILSLEENGMFDFGRLNVIWIEDNWRQSELRAWSWHWVWEVKCAQSMGDSEYLTFVGWKNYKFWWWNALLVWEVKGSLSFASEMQSKLRRYKKKLKFCWVKNTICLGCNTLLVWEVKNTLTVGHGIFC